MITIAEDVSIVRHLLHVSVPAGYVKVDYDSFVDWVSNINWIRKHYCPYSFYYFRHNNKQFAAVDGQQVFVDPIYLK